MVPPAMAVEYSLRTFIRTSEGKPNEMYIKLVKAWRAMIYDIRKNHGFSGDDSSENTNLSG